ncbi:MAG: fatty acid desaturase [Myxococcota bacterium]|nr:fatty acid desaturase [Myxococcota bacterium]
MLLRHRSDWRTLLWAFVFFPAVGFAPYLEPRLIPWLLPLSLYFGFCAGVFSHNQNHCPTFKSRKWNAAYAAWLSIFYGFPTFAWIPTHNLNHHKFVNKAGDATITWRYSKRNTWLIASTYYFVSAYWQAGPIKEYIDKARATNPSLTRQILVQRLTVVGAHLGLLAFAILARRSWSQGLLVWGFGFGIPAIFANWSMIFINYIQHVHADPWSEHNHSRNFVSKLGNWLVFNNGYHTAHHESAGLHWSKLGEAHAKIAHLVHPDLNQKSIFRYCLEAYLLGIFDSRYRTKQVGRAPYDPPQGGDLNLKTAEVAAVEAGVNASMA